MAFAQRLAALRPRRLSDWPLIVKFGVAPALSLVLLLVMAVIEVSALHSVRDNAQQIATVGVRDAAKLADIAVRFERADADLSRLLTLEAARPGEADIAARSESIRTALAEVQTDLEAFRGTEVGRANGARIDAALRDIEQYAGAVDVVTAMLGVNFASAVEMLEPFREYAQKVTSSIRDIAQSGIAEADQRARVVNSHVATTTLVFSLLALIAVPVIAVATTLVGAATVRSIREIADATADLANANYDIEIGKLARADELGAVVTALETFRQQALEARRVREMEEQSRKLELAKSAAESANRAKSDFLANMSHELRTPLNAILGYAQLLKRDPALNERQCKAARTIDASGSHLLTLINDILDLSKIEAGKFEILPATLDLRTFLSGIADIIRIRADEKALAFTCELAADLPPAVLADSKRLRQVLINLLGNAVKFTDRGQVRLVATLDSRNGGEASICFAVHDTGVGISPDQLEAIFDPFEQVGDTHRRAGGTGLGLTISRQLIQLMGSDIEVISQPGRGSCFRFVLPLEIASLAVDDCPSDLSVTGYRGDRRRILVVDDLAQNREVLAAMLSASGFDVIEAENGEAALRTAEAEHPDLVVMDIRMPVMDGLEATRRIRASQRIGGVPVIMLSAGAVSDEEERSRAVGANGFLAKPIVESSLLRAIAGQLSLDWTHADRAGFDEPASVAEPPVAPPPDDIRRLHVLALAGNMRAIRLEADALAARDACYRPFTDRLRLLASNYQSRALVDLVEHHLPLTEDTLS